MAYKKKYHRVHGVLVYRVTTSTLSFLIKRGDVMLAVSPEGKQWTLVSPGIKTTLSLLWGHNDGNIRV